MHKKLHYSSWLIAPMLAFALCLSAGTAAAGKLELSGANEVPPVTTAASGTGTITVADDGSVSGSVKATGLSATMAHIHLGARDKNGPVIIALTQSANGEWPVPAGAKLSAEQMRSCKAGELYVNVHTEAHKGGEIRAQLSP
ncbi:MAG TPA: CHRD domain-containing protein [Rubrivivax sp.]|nr:CHRD domain-containing protein [Rubrivivax sp.]